VKKDGENWMLKRSGPLPELVAREKHTIKQKADPHRAGCIVKISGLPEEASWQSLKDTLSETLPVGAKISFVSTIKNGGECTFLAKSFADDKKFFSELSLDMNGSQVKCSLAEGPDASTFLASLPQLVRKNRERELQRSKRKALFREIYVAGTKFASVDHLRQCVREVIAKTGEGESIQQEAPAFKVIKALLSYHPRSEDKLKDLAHFKVATHEAASQENSKGKQSKPAKCLFVVRSGGEEEDFSVNKCITELAKNPPFEAPSAGVASDSAKEETAASADGASDSAKEETAASADGASDSVKEETAEEAKIN